MEIFMSELQCCTSKLSVNISDLMYMRIFYVKDVMDHWDAQDFIHRSLERNITPAPAFSLVSVDGLEKENGVMLLSCFLQRAEEGIQE